LQLLRYTTYIRYDSSLDDGVLVSQLAKTSTTIIITTKRTSNPPLTND
jgi:hypothetical protein